VVSVAAEMLEPMSRHEARELRGRGLARLAPEQALERGLREVRDKGSAVAAQVGARAVAVVAVVDGSQLRAHERGAVAEVAPLLERRHLLLDGIGEPDLTHQLHAARVQHMGARVGTPRVAARRAARVRLLDHDA
jgi:hypothetical protein